MRRTVPAVLALAALLAVPQTASAKGYATASVCGTNGCHRVDAGAVRTGFEDVAPAPAPHAAPFFTVRLRARVSSGRIADVYALDWIPSERRTRGSGQRDWTRPGPRLARALDRAAHGLRPHPATGLGDVDGRPATARVVETYAPARTRGDDASTAVLAAGGGALALVALAASRRRRGAPRR